MSSKSTTYLTADANVEAACLDFIKAISAAANSLPRDEAIEIIATHLSSHLQADHRTLQAIMMGGILKGIAEYGKTASFDLRNEAPVKICRQLGETIKWAVPFPFI